MLSNIVSNPKTSIAGVLIAVVTAANVFGTQGVTLGHAGAGSVVALVASLATAFLGLLSRDPESPKSTSPVTGSVARLGALLMCILILNCLFATGCSGITVAQDIVNWTPALQSAVGVVDSTAAVLDPAGAPIFGAATIGFDAASNILVAQAKAYLANPSASVLAQLQTAVVTFQQQVNAALLTSAHIVNPASQQKALADVGAVSTIVNAILALVESISTKAQVAQMASASTIKLAAVKPLLNFDRETEMVGGHYGLPVGFAMLEVSGTQNRLETAGF